jgi:ABC-2 type transport system permease protein
VIRSLAFFRKDLFEVLRQPRLLLTLILGPFLILLAFGIGFVPDPPAWRTVLVVPPGSELEGETEQLRDLLSDQVELIGTTPDEDSAREMLGSEEADIAVVVPVDAIELIRSNQQAQIVIQHGQVDPFERSFVEVFAASAVDEINRVVLQRMVEAGQETTEAVPPLSGDLEPVEDELDVLRSLSPEVLVSPFIAVTSNFQGIDVEFSHFYVPGVVVVLLQHMALTFAALSLVRERTLGTVELFRVSPLSGSEALIGKYLAYTTIGLVVCAALVVAAVFGFGFEVAGSWLWFGIIVLLVVLAALGAGFVVSAVARTESEAVQYAMIMLLVAIFFSGFFISLERLIPPIRVVSYLIPATYGILGLQDVAFRGQLPRLEAVAGEAALAAVLLVAALGLIRTRVMAASTTNGNGPRKRVFSQLGEPGRNTVDQSGRNEQ